MQELVSGFCEFGEGRGWLYENWGDLSEAFILPYQGLSNVRDRHRAHIKMNHTEEYENFHAGYAFCNMLTLSAENLWTTQQSCVASSSHLC